MEDKPKRPRTNRGRKPGEDLSLDPTRRKNVKLAPLAEVPSAPDHLGPIGKAYWEKLTPQLVAANLLTDLHLETFAILCECYQEYRTLSDWLLKDPARACVLTESGSVRESVQVRMRDKALAQCQKMWLKFGLTPHALAGMRKHGGISSSVGKLPSVMAFAKSKYGSQD